MSDAQISNDLAAVGRTSRERSSGIDATLRAVGATVGPKPAGDIALVTLSRLYSLRVARIATGLAATLFIVARMIYVLIPAHAGRSDAFIHRLLWVYSESPLRLLAAAALVYLVAATAGARAFRRRMAFREDRRARAIALVDSIDRWSAALTIAGICTFGIAELFVRLLCDGYPLLWLQSEVGSGWTELDTIRFAIPVLAPMIASWLLGPFIARKLRNGVTTGTIGSLAAITLALVGALYLAGPLHPENRNAMAHAAGFSLAMLFGTIAFALFFVARQHNERAILDEEHAP
jgi:hypothetical protein